VEIIKTSLKPVEKVAGYTCDICKNKINLGLKSFYKYELNHVTYTRLLPGMGAKNETVIEHVCSVKCFKESLRNVLRNSHDGNIHLSSELIEELIKRRG